VFKQTPKRVGHVRGSSVVVLGREVINELIEGNVCSTVVNGLEQGGARGCVSQWVTPVLAWFNRHATMIREPMANNNNEARRWQMASGRSQPLILTQGENRFG
jgi:hypothetical protein